MIDTLTEYYLKKKNWLNAVFPFWGAANEKERKLKLGRDKDKDGVQLYSNQRV